MKGLKAMAIQRTMALCAAVALLATLPATHAVNLVINGSFEAGNSGFLSEYLYDGTPAPPDMLEGYYWVGSNPYTIHTLFDAGVIPLDGSQMMILNGAEVANTKVWYENTIAVVPSTNYYFSAWVASVYPNNAAHLKFSIDGSPIGDITPTLDGTWQQFYAVWNSGVNTVANIALVNANIIAGGNDFALDRITFDTLLDPGVPEPASLSLLAVLALGMMRRRR